MAIGHFEVFTSTSGQNIKFIINLNTIYDLFELAIASKGRDIFIAIILIFFSNKYISKNKDIVSVNKIFIPAKTFISFIIIIMAGYMTQKQNPTLISSLASLNINDVIYLTWFDLGGADVELTFLEVFNQRLEGVGGIL